MKFILCLLFLIPLSSSFSQDTLISYFDISWRQCHKDEAHFYRKAYKQSKKQWAVHDYFLNGQLQMSGYYTSKKFKTKTGKYTFYYKNSQISYEGSYSKGKLVGEWNYWHENGVLNKKSNYSEKGLLEGAYTEWYEDGMLDTQGQYLNDKMDGTWTFYFKNGQVSSVEIYSKGELVKVDFWESDGRKVEGELEVWLEPEFIGGEVALNAYIKEQVIYPQKAIDQNIFGTVYVQFVIEGDGSISEVRTIKSVHPILDQEAIRVVTEMPNWNPGKIHNRPVNVRYNLPISFVIAK